MPQSYKLIFKLEPGVRIDVKEVASSRKIDPKLEGLCRQRWQEFLQQAKNQNKKLWDSEIYRLESFDKRNNSLELKVSVIPFSVRLGMNDCVNEVKKLGESYAAFGLYTSCFVITADNKYLFIEKSGHYFTNRKISFIGGVLSKTEQVIAGGDDLYQSVLSEVTDELEIDGNIVDSMALRAGFISENYNVCMLFTVNLKKSFLEIRSQFKANDDGEAASIIGVDAAELPNFALTLPKKDWPKFEIAGLVSES